MGAVRGRPRGRRGEPAGLGRLYRDRWGVETAFRDKKGTFAAKTRSRDLGYRRFLWMILILCE
ncbi:MAG: transposase [Halorientalis sp.]